VTAASGLLVDQQTGKILWSKDEGAIRAPASLTKVLTALVVLENSDLNSKVELTQEAKDVPGSTTGAEVGSIFTVKDLLYGLLLNSGNDAAMALAQHVSRDGSIEGFMAMANRKAASLGAVSTHFVNPHGYDQQGHVTTAHDLALIATAALQNPVFAEIVHTQRYEATAEDGRVSTFINHNRLLKTYAGTIGVKTGFTHNAGTSLISAVNRNDTTLVAVVLGSPAMYGDSTSLYDWAYANLGALRAVPLPSITPVIQAPPALVASAPSVASRPAAASAPKASNLVDGALRGLQNVADTPVSRQVSRTAAFGLTLFSLIAGLLLIVGAVARIKGRQLRLAPVVERRRPVESFDQDSFPYVSR